jgi:hypothetical protein
MCTCCCRGKWPQFEAILAFLNVLLITMIIQDGQWGRCVGWHYLTEIVSNSGYSQNSLAPLIQSQLTRFLSDYLQITSTASQCHHIPVEAHKSPPRKSEYATVNVVYQPMVNYCTVPFRIIWTALWPMACQTSGQVFLSCCVCTTQIPH